MTDYYVAMQCPSKIAFASICCALYYMDLVSTIDRHVTIRFLEVMTGLNFDDQDLQQILKTMFNLMREHPRGSAAELDESVSSQDSVKCIIRLNV
jgi:hypothetical protein